MKSVIFILTLISSVSHSFSTQNLNSSNTNDLAIAIVGSACVLNLTSLNVTGEVLVIDESEIIYNLFDMKGKLIASAKSEAVRTFDGDYISASNLFSKKTCLELK